MSKQKYVLLRNVANFKKGEILELAEVPLGLQSHVQKVSDGEASATSVDTEALVKEAQKEAKAHVAELFEKVTGSKAGNSGIEKMCKEIGEAFEAKKEEAE